MALEPQDRTPEQVEEDLEALRKIRAALGLGTADHPDNGHAGAIERRLENLAAVKPAAEGRAS